MNLDQIATKCFILALFIRDDGERLLLGDGYYDFNQKLQHFQSNTIANDVVEIQGDNGQLLAGQVMRSGAQKFEGYIGDATTNRQTIEQKRSDFMAFFRIKHFYKVIYIFPDGTAIQRQRGYLTDAPTIPEIFQKFPEYSVALNFEDANYYEYAEDEHGDEIYAHIIELALSGNATGGLIWDEIGAVSNGITWSGIQTAQGEYIQVTNELDIPAKLASVEMLGDAEQDGTPTPTSPQPISVVTGENVVKITGKNLLGESHDNYGLNGNDGTIMQIANRYALIARVQEGQTYTTSRSAVGTSTYFWVAFFAEKPVVGSQSITFADMQPTTLQRTLTAPSGAKYCVIFYGAGTSPDSQLELGSTATAYEPYQGQDYAISLGTIELAKIGNYQDRIYKSAGKWYIEKQVGKVVLDGTENWTLVSTATNTARFKVQGLTSDIVINETSVLLMSNYFTCYPSNERTQDKIGMTTYINQDLYIRTDVNSISTVAALKTWLGAHNTTAYYALATSTTTEITNEALIAQLEALGASSLYIGVNNIGTETLNAMPTLKIEYYTEVELDGAGYEWEPGGNTAKTIVTVAGVDSAWPIWTIQGGAQNPMLTNITTGQTISWQGFVPEGQTLTINMAEMTADLAGANVFEYITGEWLRLAPGNNTLVYNAGNADKPSTLSWNGVLA